MKQIFQILLVIVLSVFTIKPLFSDGLFPIHDDTQVARVLELKKALSDRNFPVRWSFDLGYGYGYPLFNFYAPLPYYAGAISMFILDNPILSTKLMYGIGIIFSGIFMFLLVNELIGKYAGLASAVLYSYAPYHAVQIYVRGSVGEYWAYSLLPAAIWGFIKIVKSGKISWVFTTSIFLSFLILSHNIISMLSVLFLLLIFSIFRLKQCILSIILGLLLSAFFWMPAFFESSYTNVSSIIEGGSVFSDHFLYPDQLWDSPWGFAGSSPGRADGMSFKLGKIHIILGLAGMLTFYFLYIKKKISRKDFIIGNIFILLLFISVLMVLSVSLYIWNFLLFLLKYVQFPWRFIIFIMLSISVFAGYIFKIINKKFFSIFSLVAITVIVIIINAKYFEPKYFYSFKNSYYLNNQYLKWDASKISDEYLPKDFIKPSNINELDDKLIRNTNNLSYTVKENKTGLTSLKISLDSPTELVINKTFFPGWVGYIDGKIVKLNDKNGLISVLVPSGLHQLIFILKSTRIQLFANLISLITFLFILAILSKKAVKI